VICFKIVGFVGWSFGAVLRLPITFGGLAMAVFMRKELSKPLLQNQCCVQCELQKLLTIKKNILWEK